MNILNCEYSSRASVQRAGLEKDGSFFKVQNKKIDGEVRVSLDTSRLVGERSLSVKGRLPSIGRKSPYVVGRPLHVGRSSPARFGEGRPCLLTKLDNMLEKKINRVLFVFNDFGLLRLRLFKNVINRLFLFIDSCDIRDYMIEMCLLRHKGLNNM